MERGREQPPPVSALCDPEGFPGGLLTPRCHYRDHSRNAPRIYVPFACALSRAHTLRIARRSRRTFDTDAAMVLTLLRPSHRERRAVFGLVTALRFARPAARPAGLDCRSDRTRAGMKAALELGRWVFLAPLGYLNAPRAIGKSLMSDPERAPTVCRVFEAYASGRFTKQQVLEQARAWGFTKRRNRPLTSQAIGMLLRNQLYAGIVDVPEYGVRGKRGDFAPLISEDLFYRVQAVLAGRLPSTTPRQRAHPDFPLRAFVRCESCGRGLPGSWSKGRSEYCAYYHCRPGCRAVNVSKAMLEGLFADDLALLQPTPGYMRLLKESVLQIWRHGRRPFARSLRMLSEPPRRSRTSWTASTKRFSSSARSTSKRTTGTPRNCARTSRSFGSTVTRARSMNST